MVSQEQEKELEQSRKVPSLLINMATAMDRQDWTGAVEAGERLVELAPDLETPRTWLERAQTALKPKRMRSRPPAGSKTVSQEQNGKVMVRVPGGPFLYGEYQQTIELSEFWIDQTPVTNGEYAHFTGATGRKPPKHWKGKSPPQRIRDHPVVNVSWTEAMAYAKWAGKRLPTEEEWEKAARGTDGRLYPWGDQPPTSHLCNYGENVGGTSNVGDYSPQGDSPYGCADMAGNVWEWTASTFEEGSAKVLRGGAWRTSDALQTTDRNWSSPDIVTGYYGFRCVTDLAPGG
jgi:formylglycine-generating enzyme required for sulfatase activity